MKPSIALISELRAAAVELSEAADSLATELLDAKNLAEQGGDWTVTGVARVGCAMAELAATMGEVSKTIPARHFSG